MSDYHDATQPDLPLPITLDDMIREQVRQLAQFKRSARNKVYTKRMAKARFEHRLRVLEATKATLEVLRLTQQPPHPNPLDVTHGK